MKIAYIYDVLYPYEKGGAQKRVWELVSRLSDKHEIHLYSMKYWEGNDVIEKDGVMIHGVCSPKELYYKGRRSIFQAIYFSFFLAFSLFKEDFDLIDCQEAPYFPCIIAKTYSLLHDVPLTITWYEYWGDYWYQYLGVLGYFGRLIENMVLRLPDVIIPINEKIFDDLVDAGVSPLKMSILHNGVNVCYIDSIRASDSFSDVIYVGRLISHKNVDLLIKSMKILAPIHDFKLRIIGDGPDKQMLEELVHEQNLSDSIVFEGILENDSDVYAFMKSSKVMVLPSIREGFPNTILEANACKIPCIIVNHKNNAGTSIVLNDINGYIVELDEMEIANSIKMLLLNDELQLALQDTAYSYALNHDWSVIVNQLEGIYTKVIE